MEFDLVYNYEEAKNQDLLESVGRLIVVESQTYADVAPQKVSGASRVRQ